MNGQSFLEYINRINLYSCSSAFVSDDEAFKKSARQAIGLVEIFKSSSHIINPGKFINQEIFFSKDGGCIGFFEYRQDPKKDGGPLELCVFPSPFYSFVLHLESGADIELDVESIDESVKKRVVEGELTFIPADTEMVVKSKSEEPIHVVQLILTPDIFSKILDESGSIFSSDFKLKPVVRKENPVAAHLFLAAAGCGKEEKCAQVVSLTNAFLVYFIENYGEPNKETGLVTFTGSEMSMADELMKKNIYSNLDLDFISKKMGMSKSHFSRVLKNTVRRTPRQYFYIMRMECAKKLVISSASSITNIGLDLGFSDGAHFSKSFAKYWGVAPSKLRQSRIARPEMA